jgi:hypothetical protein
MKRISVFCVRVVTELHQLLSSHVAQFAAEHVQMLLSAVCPASVVLETLNTFNTMIITNSSTHMA